MAGDCNGVYPKTIRIPTDIAPVLSKEFPEIQATIQWQLTLKGVWT